MGAAAAIAGQNLGAGHPERSVRAVNTAAGFGLMIAGQHRPDLPARRRSSLGFFGLKDPTVLMLGRQLLRYLSVSGLFITVALTYTGGLQGTGDTAARFSSRSSSQIAVPSACAPTSSPPAGSRPRGSGRPSCSATCTRALLSAWVF